MTIPNEPIDVGPAVGGDQNIEERDRQHVLTLLTAATNEGRLPVAERDRRIGLAHQATTFDDLVPLTRDLVDLGQIPTWNTVPQAQAAPLVTTNQPTAQPGDTESDQVICIFSGTKRRGQWRVKPQLSAFCMFGGATLDMSEAIFEAKTIELNCYTMFGGVDVVVPRGVEVIETMVSLFGGTDSKKLAPHLADAPVIVIKGFNLFGGVSIKHPKN